MSKIIIGTILIIIMLSCQFKGDSNHPTPHGLYELRVIETLDSNGVWKQAEWMKNSTGVLHYGDDGTMSVHFLPENYTHHDSTSSSYWYVAKYKLFSDSGLIYHTRIMHSNPEEVGKRVRRRYEIKKDTFFMYADEYNFRLTWLKKP